jgi:hypothetical protein
LRGSLALVLQNGFEYTSCALTSLELLQYVVNLELCICPKRSFCFFSLDSYADETALCSPFAGSLNTKLVPNGVECFDQMLSELANMTWRRSNTQSFFTTGNCRKIDS